jgi:hypothetical protein
MPPDKKVQSSGQLGNRFDGETRNRKAAKNRILQQLAHYTRFKGHEGKVMVRRAEMELRGDVPRGMKGSGVDWEYWIGKWRLMSKEEIRHVVLRKLLPALESGKASVLTVHNRTRACKSNNEWNTHVPPVPKPTDETLLIRIEEMRQAGFSESNLAFFAQRSLIGANERVEND